MGVTHTYTHSPPQLLTSDWLFISTTARLFTLAFAVFVSGINRRQADQFQQKHGFISLPAPWTLLKPVTEGSVILCAYYKQKYLAKHYLHLLSVDCQQTLTH